MNAKSSDSMREQELEDINAELLSALEGMVEVFADHEEMYELVTVKTAILAITRAKGE